MFAKEKKTTNHPKTKQHPILSMAKEVTQATRFIPWKFRSKIYTYMNFQQCNFRQKTPAENKSEIKPFIFKKYIYCVLIKLFIVSRREIHWKQKKNHRSNTIAAKCIVLWLVVLRGGRETWWDKKVLYNHENSLQLADLFLAWMSNWRPREEYKQPYNVLESISCMFFFSYDQTGNRCFSLK